MDKIQFNHKVLVGLAFFSLMLVVSVVDAKGTATLGTMASGVTATFKRLALLITAASYVAGLAFSIGAIMKFKQHKDAPTQTPIGGPIGLLIVAAALLFMPSVMDMAGTSLFGGDSKTASPSGYIIS